MRQLIAGNQLTHASPSFPNPSKIIVPFVCRDPPRGGPLGYDRIEQSFAEKHLFAAAGSLSTTASFAGESDHAPHYTPAVDQVDRLGSNAAAKIGKRLESKRFLGCCKRGSGRGRGSTGGG